MFWKLFWSVAAIVTTLVLAAPRSVMANEANVMGVGYMQCSELSRLYREAPPNGNQAIDGLLNSWSDGFMSATNMAVILSHGDTNNLAAITQDQKAIELRKFCKQNPNEKVMAGVIQLYGTLPSNADGQ